ncbi:recombination mediator RecR [Bifidobacterium simiarum]|uniref:Recombination protein RecR n=1 Tax=Bifidobacterium simiarum TaxID=2045441 RepID=A0A2M9HG45_9BIFI|nr:recombination mediator RecR [Bifidobacterium simiarum]PJM75800.1 recombination protein RecR [Bifidobacterium simiarum]
MALAYDGAIQNLIDAFARLPGIGPKGAQRIAFYLLGADEAEARELADAIAEVKARVRFCDVCGNVCETSPCPICADPRRDHTIICVVQEPKDVMSIERTREFRGVYHVLGGAINPMANVGPQDLNIPKLLRRLSPQSVSDAAGSADSVDAQGAAQGVEDVREVILALNPNIEGEATTTYLARLIAPCGVKVTRLASGLPVGGDLEYADEITLGRALAGRREA